MRGEQQEHFWRLLPTRVDAYLAELRDTPGLPATLLNLAGEERQRELSALLSSRLASELPQAAQQLYQLTDESLQLQPLMREKMRQLSSQEFERVLHPVFEEDEMTLILIGTGLGGLAGFLQAAAGI